MLGLDATTRLHVHGASEIKAEWLLARPKLEALSLAKCSRIANFSTLADLPALRSLQIRECYNMDLGDDFGALRGFESIETISLRGVRKTDAALFKQRFVGKTLQLADARSEAWLRVNADNPFAAWLESGERAVATRARSIYKKACVALAKPEVTPPAARPILATFVAELNGLAKRHPFDTIMREDVDAAYEKLLTLAPGLDIDEARRWLCAAEDF